MAIRMLRLPSVLERAGHKRSSHYAKVASGLWTPPVSISSRSVAWPEDECEALLAARVAGQSDDEIRTLVTRLIAARSRRKCA